MIFKGIGRGLTLDKEGELVLTGHLFESVEFGSLKAEDDGGFVAKVDPFGKPLWIKTIANYSGHEAVVDDLNNIYISGVLYDTAVVNGTVHIPKGHDVSLVASFSAQGGPRWAFPGDTLQEGVSDTELTIDQRGNLYAADVLEDVGDFGCQQLTAQGSSDAFVTKLAPYHRCPIYGLTKACSSDTVTYYFHPASAVTSYQWRIPDSVAHQVAIVDDTTVQVAFNNLRAITLAVDLTLEENCRTVAFSEYVHVSLPSPLATSSTLSGSDIICAGQQAVVYRVEENKNVDYYHWSVPEGAILIEDRENEILVNFTDEFQRGFIQCEISNQCYDHTYPAFEVQADTLVADAQSIIGPTLVCAGDTAVTYQVPVIAGANRYHWNLPRGISTTGPSHITDTNQITVKVAKLATDGLIIVRGINECDEGKTSPWLPIDIQQKPAVAADIKGEAVICTNDKTTFRTEKIKGAQEYRWRFSAGTLSSAAQTMYSELSEITVAVIANGTVDVTGKNECGYGVASDLVRVNTLEIVDFTPPDIKKKCDVLYVEGQYDPALIQWYLNGELVKSATDRLRVTLPGLYTLSYQSPCGELLVDIEVTREDIDWFIPTAFSPNDDASNDAFVVSDRLLGSHLIVYNRWGRKVHEDANYKNTWRGRNLSAGNYYYVLRTDCTNQPITGTVTLLRRKGSL